MRIVHAMSGGLTRTTSDLLARLPDVSKATVYRHVSLLAEAGVLEVVGDSECMVPSCAVTGCSGHAP
jgi:Fe2+ or Zn2+ uptake regulation protein